MKMLVTGAAGFIGSNLAEKLIENGHEVFGFDNFMTGLPQNIENLKIKMVADISDLKVDRIFHLGIPSSSPMYRAERSKILDAIDVTLNVLELAKKYNTHVVFASTSSIYKGNKAPYKENMKVYVTDFYTEVRYFIERLFELYNKFYGVTSVGLRFFSVYGKNDEGKKQYANIVSQFALEMIKGNRPVVYGDGSQTRDFVHVNDVVSALIRASEYNGTDIFNVGTGIEKSFNDLIVAVNKTLGSNINPEYMKNPLESYLDRTLADTKKTEKILGFKAGVPFEEGIAKHVAYLQELQK
jgi:UDP-glucose 4-epimerase